MIAKSYCYLVVSMFEGKQSNIGVQKIEEIQKRDFNNLSADKVLEITRKAVKMYKEDFENDDIDGRLGMLISTSLDYLTIDEQNQLIIDMTEIAQVDGEITVERKDILKSFSELFNASNNYDK